MSLLFGLGQMYTLSVPSEYNASDANELHRALGKYNVDELMESVSQEIDYCSMLYLISLVCFIEETRLSSTRK